MEAKPLSYVAVSYVCVSIAISVICNIVLAYSILFSYSRPKNRPPGPSFKPPYVGHFYLYIGDTLKNFSDMRKK